MKKIFCLLLALCLFLSGCGTPAPAEPDPEAALIAEGEALLAEGKYAEAIRVFSSIPSYQTIAARIAEAEQLLEEEKKAEEQASIGFLYGVWHDLNSEAVLVFQENGQATLTEKDYQGTPKDSVAHYEMAQGNLRISSFDGSVSVEDRDGVTHLIANDHSGTTYDFVPEEAYEAMGPEFVTVTAENWSEYFEILSGPNWTENDFGEVNGFEWVTVLCLREEYAHRYLPDLSKVTFGYTRDHHARACQVDFGSRTVTLGGSRYRWDSGIEETCAIPDSYLLPNPYPNAVYVMHFCMWQASEPDEIPSVIDNVQITRAQGTLALRPA